LIEIETSVRQSRF